MLYSKSLMSHRTPSTRSYSPRGKAPLIQCGDRRRHTDRYGADLSSGKHTLDLLMCLRKISQAAERRDRGGNLGARRQSRYLHCGGTPPALTPMRAAPQQRPFKKKLGTTQQTSCWKHRGFGQLSWPRAAGSRHLLFQGSFERPLSFPVSAAFSR
jgi:hypothetical protein